MHFQWIFRWRNHILSITITWVLFQICKFKVGSFNYPMNKITFDSEVNWQLINLTKSFNWIMFWLTLFQFVPDDSSIKSILDYTINFDHLEPKDTHYKAIGQFIPPKNHIKLCLSYSFREKCINLVTSSTKLLYILSDISRRFDFETAWFNDPNTWV